MNKYLMLRIFGLTTLLVVESGCGLFAFDIDRSIAEQTVDGNPVGGALGGLVDVPIPLDIDLQAETAARSTGPVQKVQITGMSLSITSTAEPSGDNDDFNFLDSIEVFIRSSKEGSALPQAKVAGLENVPRDARRLPFVTTGLNIKGYIEEGAVLAVTAEGTLPPDDVSYDGRITVKITVL